MLGGLQYISKCCGNHNHVQKSKIEKLSGPEAVELLDKTARKMEPKIAQAFLDAMEGIRDRVNASQVATLLEQGRVDEVLAILSPELTEDALQGLQSAISEAVLEGGHSSAIAQPPVIGVNNAPVTFVFNATNPELARYAQQITSTRIREISNGVREVARNVITEGVTRGDNPITTARKLRDTIGLTAKQSQAVDNYRRALENLDSNALKRGLRDRRSDGVITRAISNDKPLTPKQIESLVERYRKRYIKYRSNVIGRTESIRSVQGAQHALFQSYIDQGRIKEEQVRRFWHYTQDERTRNAHIQIPSMNEKGVGQNEPFQTPLGPLMFPGDPNGTAENVAQCRCACFVRVISLELLEPSNTPTNVVIPVNPKPKKKHKKPLRPIDVLSGRPKRETKYTIPAFDTVNGEQANWLSNVETVKGIRINVKKGSYYNSRTQKLFMGSKRGTNENDDEFKRTFRHEYGHHIDRDIYLKDRKTKKTFDDKSTFASYSAVDNLIADGRKIRTYQTDQRSHAGLSDNKKKAMSNRNDLVLDQRRDWFDALPDNEDDRKRVVLSMFNERGLNFDEVSTFYNQIKNKDGDVNPFNSLRFLSSWDHNDHMWLLEYGADWDNNLTLHKYLSGVSDTIEASVAGDFKYRFGHGRDYYDKRLRWAKKYGTFTEDKSTNSFFTDSNTTQAFANWIETELGPSGFAKKMYKKFFPNTSKAFEKIAKEYLS